MSEGMKMKTIKTLFATKALRHQEYNLQYFVSLCLSGLFLLGCGATELKPVELFPEDECANCRMSVSNPAFASEIISQNDEVFKFDDLSCLEQFRKQRNDVNIAAIFVKEYETKQWLRYENSVIILTGIATPMGSGRIAVANSERAKALTEQFPVKNISEKMGKECCGDKECNK
jgi:copper chaperone NosL